jgi:hypothetical protein
MDLIVEAFADFSRQYLIKGFIDPKLVMEELFNISPGFRTCPFFLDIFPTVFHIELCKSKLEKNVS